VQQQQQQKEEINTQSRTEQNKQRNNCVISFAFFSICFALTKKKCCIRQVPMAPRDTRIDTMQIRSLKSR